MRDFPLTVFTEATMYAGIEDWRDDYSGRFMFGQTCPAIVIKSQAQYAKFVMALVHEAVNYNLDPEVVEDFLAAERRDDMGLDTVIYFPDWKLHLELPND